MAKSIIVLGIGAGDSIYSFLTGGLNANPVVPVVGYGEPVTADTRRTIKADTRSNIEADTRQTIKA